MAFSQRGRINIFYKQTGTATAKKMTNSGSLCWVKWIYITYYLQSNRWRWTIPFSLKLLSNLTKMLFYVAQSIKHSWCKHHFRVHTSYCQSSRCDYRLRQQKAQREVGSGKIVYMDFILVLSSFGLSQQTLFKHVGQLFICLFILLTSSHLKYGWSYSGLYLGELVSPYHPFT